MVASEKTIERLERLVFSHDIGRDSSTRKRIVRMQGISIECATPHQIYLTQEPILFAAMMKSLPKRKNPYAQIP
jgi:hypothetical protein